MKQDLAVDELFCCFVWIPESLRKRKVEPQPSHSRQTQTSNRDLVED